MGTLLASRVQTHTCSEWIVGCWLVCVIYTALPTFVLHMLCYHQSAHTS